MPEPQPLFILPQQKSRILVPKIISFLFLSIIFYLGILVNISLLKLAAPTESTIKLSSLIVLILVVIFGIAFNIKKSRQKYFFYQNKIVFKKKEILLSEITDIKPRQNLLDKLFKTHSLILNQQFKINNIPQKIQLQGYIQKLIDYSKH
jgi:hypothetical protein